MPESYVPAGKSTLCPYLIVTGASRLIDFLKQALDAEELHRTTRPDGSVMHAELRIDGATLMLGEAGEAWPPMPASVHLYVPDTDAVYQRALAAGAESLMEPADQFYGDRMSGIKDPSGNLWWLATHQQTLSSEELQQRAEAELQRRAEG